MTASTHPADADASGAGSTRVVMNDEGQYSIWPTDRPMPAGWTDVGVHGSTEDCLAHIERVWTDLRPNGALDGLS